MYYLYLKFKKRPTDAQIRKRINRTYPYYKKLIFHIETITIEKQYIKLLLLFI